MGTSKLWLWEHLREPYASIVPADPLAAIDTLLPPTGRVWLLFEDWGARKKKLGNFWVFDAEAHAVVPLLREMFHLEYYVVDKRYRWMLCENHHGFVSATGTMARALTLPG